MKKILLRGLPEDVPNELKSLIYGAPVYDTSSSPDAKVYFIDKDGGLYLKRSDRGTLKREAEMTEYFFGKNMGAQVLGFVSDRCDWLLTAAVEGEDGVSERYLNDPKRLCDTIAYELRRLHETKCDDCPVKDRTAQYLSFAENNYKTGAYDKAQLDGRFGFTSKDDAFDVLQEGKNALKDRVLLHGDYCLPNIILKNWRLSGFIDVGCGGIGDRHIDLFWAVWTLWRNLNTDSYTSRLLDAYGRDKADEKKLKIIAAAEIFG